MTTEPLFGVPNDEILDRLEALLEDPALENTLRLDEAQGFLCAALSGPEPLTQEAWLLEVLGSEAAVESKAGREAAGLFIQFAAALEKAMDAGEPPLLLLYAHDRSEDSKQDDIEAEEDTDYASWCQAYLAGVDASATDWFEYLGDSDGKAPTEEAEDEILYLDEHLYPMMVLTGEAEEAAREHGEPWLEGDELDELIGDCVEALPVAVTEIYRFWKARRGVSPVRHLEPKTGRNEPCPCGSGKKYKHCCGKE